MTDLATLKAQWLKDKEFAQAYDALELEFALSQTLIKARARAGMGLRNTASSVRRTSRRCWSSAGSPTQ